MSTKNSNSPQKHPCLDGISRQLEILPSLDFEAFNIELQTTITHGHGVASRPSGSYPAGTIELQYPFFKKLGLDLGHCYCGTLNLSIAPKKYKIYNPSHNFKDVDWYPPRKKTENFLFCDCAIKLVGGYVPAYVYQPDVQTKTEHFDDPHALQVISPFIEELKDLKNVLIFLKGSQCLIEE